MGDGTGETRSVWVVVEAGQAGLRECSLEAIDEGRRAADALSAPLAVVVAGAATEALAAAAAACDVDRIERVENPLLADYDSQLYSAALAELFRRQPAQLLLFSATVQGLDLAPRLAAVLDLAYFADCIQVKVAPQGGLRFTRPTHQEKIYTTYAAVAGSAAVASLRPGVIGVDKPRGVRTPQQQLFSPDLSGIEARVRRLERIPGDPKLVDLATADKIVSGGRGVGAAEDWKLIEDLADALGASVGASRVAVDLGYAARSRLVGQTGKSVHPRLYLAAGISGVFHHLGAIDAENLIAINTDRSAPIFKRSGLGIVGDLHQVIPALVRRLHGQGAGQGGSLR
jgi:electron transfer flavoprotein alpha subunit